MPAAERDPVVFCAFVHQSVRQHPGGGGERCGEREESAAAAPAAA